MNRVNMLESLSDNIIVDKDKCTSCGICVDTCILDNLRLQLSPCRQACPLGVNCQGYVQLIARGEEAKALELLRETLPFPGILGRIWEGTEAETCVGVISDHGAAPDVRIANIRKFLHDRGFTVLKTARKASSATRSWRKTSTGKRRRPT